jgi:hypothetical protein
MFYVGSLDSDKLELVRLISKSLGVPEADLLVNEPLSQKLKVGGLVLATAIPIIISMVQLLIQSYSG